LNTAPDANTFAGRLAPKLPFFYGWIAVCISFLGVFWMGATSYWGIPVFLVPMRDDTGWADTSIVAGLSLRFLLGATGGLFLGRFADRRGWPPKLLLAGILIDSLALIALRWVQSPLQFLLVYGVIGGLGTTGKRVVQSTLVAKWFVARRGTAVGISSNGGGFAALIMVPLTAFLIAQLGWRDAWVALALVQMAMLLPFVPLAVRAPEDIGLEPDGGEPGPGARVRASASTERSYSLSEAAHTSRFWLLMLAVLFGNYSLQTNSVVMVPYFREIGFTAAVVAGAFSIYGIFSIATRLMWGYIADRLRARRAIILQSVLTSIAAFCILQVGGTLSLYLVIGFVGVVMSGYPTLQILLWPEFFGRRHIGSIVGVTQFFATLSGAAGPLVAAYVNDQTGSYESTVWVLVASWLLCAVVIFMVRPSREAVTPETVLVSRDG
jgi:MFS family permease